MVKNISDDTGNDGADGWETLGNLALKVLSCTYEARKKATGTGGVVPVARHAQTTTTGRTNVAGDVASN